MAIKLVCVGKIKEDYITKGILHFTKNKNINIIEVDDEKAPEKLSEKEMIQIKNIEGEKILSKIDERDFVVALDIKGKEITENDLQNITQKNANIAFVIGGSLGLSTQVLKRANEKISFSKMTFTHQQMRLILVERLRI